MWIARNEDEVIHAFFNKPSRLKGALCGIWDEKSGKQYRTPIILKCNSFPDITWKSKPLWKRILKMEWIQEDQGVTYHTYRNVASKKQK